MLCDVNSYIYRTAVFGQINQLHSYGAMLTLQAFFPSKKLFIFFSNFLVCVCVLEYVCDYDFLSFWLGRGR